MNSIVDDFWKKVSGEAEDSIRWTPKEMLEEDKNVITTAMNSSGWSWLDIGAGSGDLQKSLQDNFGFCLAVDAEPQMSKFFTRLRKVSFLPLSVAEIDGTGDFDLVTAFGLVTCLTELEEKDLYRRISHMTKFGKVIVKNQVAFGKAKVVEHFSENLGTEYFGRYPNFEKQGDLLSEYFEVIDLHRYPDALNKHADTFHAAFVCVPR